MPSHEDSGTRLKFLVVPMKKAVFLRGEETQDYIGVLNEDTGGTLLALKEIAGVRLEAIMHTKDLGGSMKCAKKLSSRSAITKVEVVIFGRRSMSQVVGDMLSQSNHFLQQPEIPELQQKFENPHWLDCAKLFGVEYVQSDQYLDVGQELSAPPVDDYNVSAVFNDFACGYNLQPQDAHVNVKTALLRFVQILTFIKLRNACSVLLNVS